MGLAPLLQELHLTLNARRTLALALKNGTEQAFTRWDFPMFFVHHAYHVNHMHVFVRSNHSL